MAKKVHSITVKGDLDVSAGTITEYDKEGGILGVYKIEDLLREFDGTIVTLSIKEQEDLLPSE